VGRFLSLTLLAIVGLGGLLLSKQYSTLGCSDVSLPSNWRPLAPLESVIGVLMCGISVSLLFAIITRLIDREARFSRK
jgi:hypothetical protein